MLDLLVLLGLIAVIFAVFYLDQKYLKSAIGKIIIFIFFCIGVAYLLWVNG